MGAQAVSVERWSLGEALQKLRRESGATREQVAAAMEWSVSKLYRVEYGKAGIKSRDLRDLCDFYGVSEAVKDTLAVLAEDARQPGWWKKYEDVFRGIYVGLEDRASEIRTYEGECVPGLFQTEGYARAVIRTLRPTATPDEIKRRVAARMARQGLLDRADPPTVLVIINEAVLWRCLGTDHETAAGQLRALLAAGERPNVTLSVLPFAAGLHACMEGSFVTLALPEGRRLAYVEGLMGDVYVQHKKELIRYDTALEEMAGLILSPEESADFIQKMLERM